MPVLYKGKLHESPVLEGNNYERFDLQWVLDTSSSSSDADDSVKFRIQPGDVLYMPELLSGAGEFEAMRFVGNPVVDGNDSKNMLPLLHGGVEYPEFPPEIAELHNEHLRDAYAGLFDAMLETMTGGPGCLQEVMGGGDAEIDEYWSSPPLTRPKRQPPGGKWIIPLKSCQVQVVPDGKS